MIAHLIRWSVRNRFFVVLGMLALVGAGLWAVRSTPIDALPDLSDVQVVIRTSYPGQAPQIVENQITYPLTTTMLSVPGAKTVRGYSFFGDSFVYVIFEDGTDLYWARSRVLEYLNQVQGRLPASARSALGPDATRTVESIEFEGAIGANPRRATWTRVSERHQCNGAEEQLTLLGEGMTLEECATGCVPLSGLRSYSGDFQPRAAERRT